MRHILGVWIYTIPMPNYIAIDVVSKAALSGKYLMDIITERVFSIAISDLERGCVDRFTMSIVPNFGGESVIVIWVRYSFVDFGCKFRLNLQAFGWIVNTTSGKGLRPDIRGPSANVNRRSSRNVWNAGWRWQDWSGAVDRGKWCRISAI